MMKNPFCGVDILIKFFNIWKVKCRAISCTFIKIDIIICVYVYTGIHVIHSLDIIT